METAYSNFFTSFGSAMHYDYNYQLYTESGTKNTRSELAESLLARIVSIVEVLELIFPHIINDRNAGKLNDEKYTRYMRYFNLLLTDTTVVSKRLLENKKLCDVVKAVAGKKYAGIKH